jgi:hypothetical protein
MPGNRKAMRIEKTVTSQFPFGFGFGAGAVRRLRKWLDSGTTGICRECIPTR